MDETWFWGTGCQRSLTVGAFADGTFRRAGPPETHLWEWGLCGARSHCSPPTGCSHRRESREPVHPTTDFAQHKSQQRQTRSGSYTMTPVKHLIGGLQKHWAKHRWGGGARGAPCRTGEAAAGAAKCAQTRHLVGRPSSHLRKNVITTMILNYIACKWYENY